MTPSDLAYLFIRKGIQDEDAATALLENHDIADEIVGFHCKQAAEKYLNRSSSDKIMLCHLSSMS